jgi:hypothetical protein
MRLRRFANEISSLDDETKVVFLDRELDHVERPRVPALLLAHEHLPQHLVNRLTP